jgi:hypothetical protein
MEIMHRKLLLHSFLTKKKGIAKKYMGCIQIVDLMGLAVKSPPHL